MEFILLIAACVCSALACLLVIFKPNHKADPSILQAIANTEMRIQQLENHIKDDFKMNRQEAGLIAKHNREELNNTLTNLHRQNTQTLHLIQQTLANRLDTLITKMEEQQLAARTELSGSLRSFALEQRNNFADLKNEQNDFAQKTMRQLEQMTEKLDKHLSILSQQAKLDSNNLTTAITTAINNFGLTLDKSIQAFNQLQKEKFEQLEMRQNELIINTANKLETIRTTVEEKLEKTLSERLGQSFELVGKQLIEVQKGLGEMQTIAGDVGGLKKVLSNVKLRGGVGEVQLAILLEQMLAPNQYVANVKTKVGSNEPVEFAVKLPGRSETEGSFVYLPIDAKFPKDVYEHLLVAYDKGTTEAIDVAVKQLEATMRKMAKDIHDKYIDPPNTTDFAILFLPFESIYAEVIRRNDLVDLLRKDYHIAVAGPTTLMAILNSLQMGFRTLALQKRSSEVWQVLGSVKTEFQKFGGLLEKAQKNLHTASDTVDELLGKRSRAIHRKLKNIEALPTNAAEESLLVDGGTVGMAALPTDDDDEEED